MMPEWIKKWILKDRLVGNKFRISREYFRHPKSIQFVNGKKNEGQMNGCGSVIWLIQRSMENTG